MAGRWLALGLGAAALAGVVAALGGASEARRAGAQEGPGATIYMPMSGKNLLRPWSRPEPLPSATPTPLREAPPPDLTPEPTRDTRRAPHPRGAEDIVLQIGRTDTVQEGEAWEEMNGTPYLTLYGDGRLLAYPYLMGWDQDLRETRLDGAAMQELLVALHYRFDFFALRSIYRHPSNSALVGHLYLRFGSGEEDWKRVQITGLPRWRRDDLPPDGVEDGATIKAVVDWLYGLEDLTATLEEPYAVQEYTIIAHEIFSTGDAPRWPLSLDVKAISDGAPLRTADGHPHGPPGHRFVGPEVGDEVRAVTRRDALANHPGQNYAAKYKAAGSSNYVVVGARPEVPGRSLFLPDRVYDRWYREDGGG